ncbi:MAG: SoxR reducing system RseC family protein [Bacteroidales bacterium]
MVSESETVVSISPSTACSGCHAAGFCNVTGDTKKTITVTGSHSVKEGDNVMVYMEAGLGYNAVILGYVTPLFVTLITLLPLPGV